MTNRLMGWSDKELQLELARREKERHDNFIAELDTLTIQDYIDGYETGYDWLAHGLWNFIHPTETYHYNDGRSVLRGYIPGGPAYWNNYDRWRNPKEYARQNTLNSHAGKRWRQGFIDGINYYVRLHNLPYPQI